MKAVRLGFDGGRVAILIYLLILGALLVGYMFLGRGFAHIRIGPVFIGDWVLILGVAVAAFVVIRARVRPPVTWTILLLVAFAALGALRTAPYVGPYGMDALRDGVLWGYAAFALIVYVLVDRHFVLSAFRTYGWIVPVFALWLPICWNLFRIYSREIDPERIGADIPLVFFKGGDMAIHAVGAIAFLVLGATRIATFRTFLWRMILFVPLMWTIFVAGTSNRGALLTAAIGIVAIVIFAPRSRNWLPFLAAIGLGLTALVLQGVLVASSTSTPVPTEPTPTPTASPTPRPVDRIAVRNPGFELGVVGNGGIDGWAPSGAGTYNIVEGDAHLGTNFAVVENTGGAYQGIVTSSTFPFQAGEDIAISVWVKAITGRPVLEIYVNWFDRSGELLFSQFAPGAIAADSTWQEGVGIQTAPEGTTHAQVLFYEAAGAATIGIDDVTVRSGQFVPEPIPPAPSQGRPLTLQQMIENLFSVFGESSDPGLEGTKQFRLAWWGEIVDYTVFGEQFLTGKGFGVNLADDDGFQTTADGSLRAPHNSHLTVLARMGVPGFVLWLFLQGAFSIGLLRATLAHRRAGEARLAAVGAWILVYWVTMMVDTSFDPYLEGPQGGIWFWATLGLGLVVMRLVPRPR